LRTARRGRPCLCQGGNRRDAKPTENRSRQPTDGPRGSRCTAQQLHCDRPQSSARLSDCKLTRELGSGLGCVLGRETTAGIHVPLGQPFPADSEPAFTPLRAHQGVPSYKSVPRLFLVKIAHRSTIEVIKSAMAATDRASRSPRGKHRLSIRLAPSRSSQAVLPDYLRPR